jgi:hypothetical protein
MFRESFRNRLSENSVRCLAGAALPAAVTAIGTVKKSKAALSSRWLFRNGSHRFAFPSSLRRLGVVGSPKP